MKSIFKSIPFLIVIVVLCVFVFGCPKYVTLQRNPVTNTVCDKIPDTDARLECADYISSSKQLLRKMEQRSVAIGVSKRIITQSLLDTQKTATEAIIDHYRRYGALKKKYVCRRRQNGSYMCLAISDLLAYQTKEFALATLKDLHAIDAIMPEEQSKGDALAACGNQSGPDWISVNTMAGSSLQAAVYMNHNYAQVSKLCALVQQSLDSGNPSPGSFSGITGIGQPNSLLGNCGLDINSNPGLEILNKMIQINETLAQECGGEASPLGPNDPLGTDPLSTLMSGNDSSGDGSDSNTNILHDSEGNVIGVEYTDSSTGETVRIDFTDDGPVVTSTSADNNTTITTAADNTTTITHMPSDGRTDTYTTDSSGNVTEYSKTIAVKDGDETIYKKKTYDGQGNWVSTEQWNAINSMYSSDFLYMRDHRDDSLDLVIIGDSYSNRRYDRGPDGNWRVHPIGPIDCTVAASCESCQAADRAFKEMFKDCVISEGGSPSCGAYTDAYDCCNGSVPGVNPGLIIPNPMNEYECAGDIDVDMQSDQCKNMCKFAYHEDCESNCNESRTLDFEWSLFDQACRYMYSDQCFGVSGGTPYMSSNIANTMQLGHGSIVPPQILNPEIRSQNNLVNNKSE